MLHLDLLSSVDPLGSHLSDLVLGVDVVENGELGTNHVGEVSRLNNTNVPSDKELVMEEHTSKPFVVGPSAHSGEGSDGSNVEEEEDKTSSGAGERFVVRRNLLGADGFHEVSQVVVVRVHQGVGGGVVRVDVTLSHGVNFVAVVALSVKGLVLGLGAIVEKRMFRIIFKLSSKVKIDLKYLRVSSSSSGSGSSLFGGVSLFKTRFDGGGSSGHHAHVLGNHASLEEADGFVGNHIY